MKSFPWPMISLLLTYIITCLLASTSMKVSINVFYLKHTFPNSEFEHFLILHNTSVCGVKTLHELKYLIINEFLKTI